MAVEAPQLPEAWKNQLEKLKAEQPEAEEEVDDETDYIGMLKGDVVPKPEPVDDLDIVEKSKKSVDPKKEPTYVDDSYAECYPGYVVVQSQINAQPARMSTLWKQWKAVMKKTTFQKWTLERKANCIAKILQVKRRGVPTMTIVKLCQELLSSLVSR